MRFYLYFSTESLLLYTEIYSKAVQPAIKFLFYKIHNSHLHIVIKSKIIKPPSQEEGS